MKNTKQKLTAYFKGLNFSSTVLVAVIIALVVFVNIIIYTLSTVVPLYIHAPEGEDLTISNVGDHLFDRAMRSGKKVTVTFCSYEDVVSNHETGKLVYQTAKQFAERYPELITLEYVNVITKLDSNGKSVAERLKVYEDDENVHINSTSVIFSTDTNYRVLTDYYTSAGYADFYTLNESLYITSYNGEEVFALSVIWAITDDHPTAYFTAGHGETSDMTMQTILNAAGYNVKQIDLRHSDVPEDAGLLVISNPIADFERAAEGASSSIITEYDRLEAYAKRGGSFYIIMNRFSKKLPVLESFVGDFGIGYFETEENEKFIVKDSSNAITTDGFTLVADYTEEEIPSEMKNVISKRTEESSPRVVLREAVALELSGSATPVLVSSSSSVCQAGGKTVNSDGNYVLAAYSERANDAADKATMFFMFDGSLASSDAIITNGYSNKDFLYSLFDVAYGRDDLPYGCRTVLYNKQILENLTMGTARLYTALLLALPVACASVGAVVMIRRKNR